MEHQTNTLKIETDESRTRKSSFNRDDLKSDAKFEVKPSTELIPDEYEHLDNKCGAVYIFHSNKKSDEVNIDKLLETLVGDHGYEISDENIFEIKTKQGVIKKSKEIADTDFTKKSCLIIIFFGDIDDDDQFLLLDDKENTLSTKDVWINFINCPTLKYKPKIFIFQADPIVKIYEYDSGIKAPSQVDSHDIPSEADILIIYKRIEAAKPECKLKFINEFCYNLREYGCRDDIIALLTHTDSSNGFPPVMISTLTRKFYISSSQYREHFFDIEGTRSQILKIVDELHARISELEGKKKVTSSFRRIVNTFRSKLETSRPEPKVENNSSDVPQPDKKKEKDKLNALSSKNSLQKRFSNITSRTTTHASGKPASTSTRSPSQSVSTDSHGPNQPSSLNLPSERVRNTSASSDRRRPSQSLSIDRSRNSVSSADKQSKSFWRP